MSDFLGLVPNAYALRLCRTIKSKNSFRLYDPVTFPKDPRGGCLLYLRRCQAFGYLVDDSPFVVDVLDANDDIIQDYSLTREGFNWLKRAIKTGGERAQGDE
jgi:hypothetical protein